MVRKSLSSRRFKCFHLSLLAVVGLASTALARPILFVVDSTPYDRQMLRVQPILAAVEAEPADEVSLAVVNQWMSRLRRIPYRYSKEWKTPAEVGLTKRADCKGKAVTLYQIMRQIGATDFRLIIGRRRAGDWFTHAWLEWETTNGRYVLDPTFSRHAVRLQKERRNKYVPLYAYEGGVRYRALNDRVPAEMAARAVASGKPSWNLDGSTGLE